MKLITIFISAVLLVSSGFGASRVTVKKHTTKKGTVVAAHQRTAPNKTQKDNWSTKGNTNPATGKKGTLTPNK